VGDVVGTDQDHRDVRLQGQRPVDLPPKIPGLRTDERERTQVHPTVGTVDDPGRQVGTGGVLHGLDAVAGRRGVAEQRDVDRRSGSALAVPAARVGGPVVGVADGSSGDHRLDPQHAVQRRAHDGEAAAAISGSGG
jgi:hypothetical protein